MSTATGKVHDATSAVSEVIRFLQRRALRLTGSDSDAWDLVQDALERAVRQWPKSWAGTELRRWLNVVLRNLNLDRVRSRGWRAALTLEADGVEALRSPDPVEVAPWRAVDPERVEAGLARLPEQHRQILLMRVEGKSLQEIGRATGINPATVGTKIFRAKKQMRAILGLPPAVDGHRRRRRARALPAAG